MHPGMIEVTGVPLKALVKAAYALSAPQGLGVLHAKQGELSDEDAEAIIGREQAGGYMAAYMDYVHGRSCKFSVRRDKEQRLFIDHRWYDHSHGQVRSLLEAVGLSPDLADRARTKREEYENECVNAAMAVCEKLGGEIVENYDSKEETPDNILTGLYLAQERGLLTHKWEDRRRIWSAVRPENQATA